jgi:HlyD family secretion protein
MPDISTERETPPGRSTRSSALPRLYWVAGAVAAIVIALGVWWWRSRAESVHYVTARVTRGNIQRTVSMTGALNPVVTAQVGSYVSGNIKSWACDYNTVVKIGQRCALIDPLPFQVVVDEDEADVRTAKAQTVKDRAAAANAALIYDHDKKLIGEGVVSQETLDTDKATLDQDLAQIELDVATEASKKAILHAAQVNLGYTSIVSPVDGMVITRYIDVGQTVVSSLQSSTLFLIGKDMSKMQVDTNVSEADVGEVHAGENADFTVQAYPSRTFQASVRQVRRGPITVQNVVTYDVVLDVDNADMALFPGMTADAHIITAERKNVFRVPLPATRFVPEGLVRAARSPGEGARGGAQRPESASGRAAGTAGSAGGGEAGGAPRARLWLLHDGKLTPVRVRTGLDDGTLIEVTSDELKEGDVVVVNAVRPEESRAAAAAVSERQAGGNQSARPATGLQGGGFRQ